MLFYGKSESSYTTKSHNTLAFRLANLMKYPTLEDLEYYYA